MKERPILFSGAMVRALLANAKTQTRRIVKPQPTIAAPDEFGIYGVPVVHPHAIVQKSSHGTFTIPTRCPYGVVGDRLWVKESIRLVSSDRSPGCDQARYTANGAMSLLDTWPWQRDVLPGMFMPRGLARIKLEVTVVRVQRLHDITKEDALAEGVERVDGWVDDAEICRVAKSMGWMVEDLRSTFGALWCEINGVESWLANPWVWAISFRVVTP